jgi:hypothetical protein
MAQARAAGTAVCRFRKQHCIQATIQVRAGERIMKHLFRQTLAMLFLLLIFSPTTNAQVSPQQFARLPYFTPESTTCTNDVLAFLKTSLKGRNLNAEQWQKVSDAVYAKLSARDVLRPFVDGGNVLMGTNMRWISIAPDCHNALLYCSAERADSCAELATFPNDQVLAPLFFSQDVVIAEREVFPNDVLNGGKTDFVMSDDKGRNWRKVNVPVACGARGWWCRLLVHSARQYTLIASKIAEDKPALFEDVAIHTTLDGGNSWELSTAQWHGMNSPAAIEVSNGRAIGLPKEQGEVIAISRHSLANGADDTITTSIPAAQWDTRFDSSVFDIQGNYLLRINARMPGLDKNVGVFLVAQDQATPSGKLVWQSAGMAINFMQASASALVIRTWDSKSMLVARGVFREKLNYSLDGGQTWKVWDIPEALLGATLCLSGNELWWFLPAEIHHVNLDELKAQ